MAYAEKRGKGPTPWRVRYKLSDGKWETQPGFETKEEALNWGRDQEADIRRGKWRDPRAGNELFEDWAEKWLDGQDLNINTFEGYVYLLNGFIIPRFGKHPLNAIADIDVKKWERTCAPALKSSPKKARTLLHTILEDAIDAGKIDVNPAKKKRNRGRAAGRKKTRAPEQVWADPLQTLLIAERCALMSGCDDDFILIILIAYTGMRWGEVVGLLTKHFRLSTIQVEQQIYELKGRFILEPPKYDSYRTLDIPPFLSALLSILLKRRHDHQQCKCPDVPDLPPDWEKTELCTGARYMWLGPKDTHARRSNYSRQTWHPAVDGVYPGKGGLRPWPARPVLVDMAPGWPGVPLRPPWPYAVEGVEWEPPRGKGLRRHDELGAEVASWLPVCEGLTPHLLRHSHKTWMDEDLVPDSLKDERMGHDKGASQGVSATYSHVSKQIRKHLVDGLSRRWETALAERLLLDPHSPVKTLDDLLGAIPQKIISQISPKHTVTDLRSVVR